MRFFIRVKECVASYILQYMQSENANKQLLNSANASAQAGVYLGAISDIEVYMPCCVKEQQAIAQVLSDMDSEIEQQEKKLAKYQQIKQGMMQELLTGRIRLVDADRKEQPKTQILQERQPAHNQHFDDAVMTRTKQCTGNGNTLCLSLTESAALFGQQSIYPIRK